MTPGTVTSTTGFSRIPLRRRCVNPGARAVDLVLDRLNLDAVFFHAQFDFPKRANIEVRHKHQREQRHQVTAPVVVQQLVARDEQKEQGHVMTEAVFTGEEVKELAAEHAGMPVTLADTVFTRLTKHLFVSHCPGDAGDGDGQHEQPNHLIRNRHNC